MLNSRRGVGLNEMREFWVIYYFNRPYIIESSEADLKKRIKILIRQGMMYYPQTKETVHLSQIKALEYDWENYSLDLISERLINGSFRKAEAGQEF